jgi:hypothetical protein
VVALGRPRGPPLRPISSRLLRLSDADRTNRHHLCGRKAEPSGGTAGKARRCGPKSRGLFAEQAAEPSPFELGSLIWTAVSADCLLRKCRRAMVSHWHERERGNRYLTSIGTNHVCIWVRADLDFSPHDWRRRAALALGRTPFGPTKCENSCSKNKNLRYCTPKLRAV